MKIAVLLSGGVDSSVALNLLKKEGHDLTAFYLKIWLEDELSYLGSCPWEEDLVFAKAVCEKLNVPLEIVPFQREYWDNVVQYTINEIKSGRTPNPDIMCNSLIKFGAFEKNYGHLFDKIATGHYADVIEINNEINSKQNHDQPITNVIDCKNFINQSSTNLDNKNNSTNQDLINLLDNKNKKQIQNLENFSHEYHLYSSPDPIKDQTYFLSMLNQKQLSKAIFPIGKFYKTDVRKLAKEFDLPNKDRKDSQGICFLGKIKFSDFVKYHVGIQKGNIIEYETGLKVAEHDGFWYYTIGQRHSIGLSGGPWYVVSKDTKDNIIYISKNYYSEDKTRKNFQVKDFNWIGKPPLMPASLLIKLRHGPKLYKANVSFEENCYQIKLDENDQGIAPGQFAVLYDKNRCLGGGVMI